MVSSTQSVNSTQAYDVQVPYLDACQNDRRGFLLSMGKLGYSNVSRKYERATESEPEDFCIQHSFQIAESKLPD